MKDKIKAFLLHLFVSALVALLVIYVIFYIWYPDPIAKAVGVKNVTWMLIVIDVILGPLLTFIVYKKYKKSLKLDLLFIVLVQLSALIYGVWSISQVRPIWIVQTYSLFQIVTPKDLSVKSLADIPVEFKKQSWLGPKWVATNDNLAREHLIFEPSLDPTFYSDLSNYKERIRLNAKKLDILKLHNKQDKINQILEKYPKAEYWMPLRTSNTDLTVLLDGQYEVIKIVDLRPWS